MKTKPKIEIDLAKVEAFAARGLTQEQIADALGISPRTLQSRKAESAEFADAIKRGQSRGIAQVANALFEKVKGGDTTAMIFFLKARAGWKEAQRIELEDSEKTEGMKSVYAKIAQARANKKDG